MYISVEVLFYISFIDFNQYLLQVFEGTVIYQELLKISPKLQYFTWDNGDIWKQAAACACENVGRVNIVSSVKFLLHIELPTLYT